MHMAPNTEAYLEERKKKSKNISIPPWFLSLFDSTALQFYQGNYWEKGVRQHFPDSSLSACCFSIRGKNSSSHL